MPAFTSKRNTPRRFVPEGFNPTDIDSLNVLFDDLEMRSIQIRAKLEKFILDWEELSAVLYECYSLAYIDMTVDTSNAKYEAHYLRIVDEVLPVKEQRDFTLKQKLLESRALSGLSDDYAMYLRNIRSEVELFREENIPLMQEDRRLEQEFNKIVGAQEAEFRGKAYTLPQLLPFLEEQDRATREEAWRARWNAKLADADALDDLYSRMYEVRQKIAQNAGFANFRDYKFQEMKRFDYTPAECATFHDAIARYVTPVVAKDWAARAEKLGLDDLKPWDVDVDPEGAPPLKLFTTAEELEEGCYRIVKRIDPELAGFFREMIDNKLFDLDNRPGKAPGGYMDMLSDMQVPFVFMNAVGSKDDVETLLHEGGHSFHYYLARKLPLYSYHGTTHEFSEVASMSMELLARPYLDEFYTEEQLTKLLKDQLRDKLRFFPFMAMIDAFQHWVYTADDHSAEARRMKWTELEERFRPGLDWSGLEQFREIGWQYPHVFDSPFYYVEYGIAQLAALRVWLNSLEDEKGALAAYKKGLSLGGSKPLPILFETVGSKFALNDETVSEIVEGTLAQIGG